MKLKTKKLKEEIATRKTNIEAYTNKLNFLTDVVKAHTEPSGVAIMENSDSGEQNNIIEDVPNGDTKADGSDSWNFPKVGLTNKNIEPCKKPNITIETVNTNIDENGRPEMENPNDTEAADVLNDVLKG